MPKLRSAVAALAAQEKIIKTISPPLSWGSTGTLKSTLMLVFVGFFLTACGGGSSDSGGGNASAEDAAMTPTATAGGTDFDLSGNWQGKSVVQCRATACNWDIDCSINQNGNQTDGTCSSTLTNETRSGCDIPDVIDQFTSTISGNKTTLDFYNQPASQGLEVTINSSSSMTVPGIAFNVCVQEDPFSLSKI